MNNISYTVTRDDKGNVTILGDWIASAASFICNFQDKTQGNGDSGAAFSLKIEGGEVDQGNISMDGTLERAEFIETLEVVLRELKRDC